MFKRHYSDRFQVSINLAYTDYMQKSPAGPPAGPAGPAENIPDGVNEKTRFGFSKRVSYRLRFDLVPHKLFVGV